MINQTSFNLTDLPKKTYNGWADWTSWNCALWVGGDEGLYNLAKDCDSWFDFIICMQDMGMNKTQMVRSGQKQTMTKCRR